MGVTAMCRYGRFSLPYRYRKKPMKTRVYGQGTVGLWSDLLNHPLITQ